MNQILEEISNFAVRMYCRVEYDCHPESWRFFDANGDIINLHRERIVDLLDGFEFEECGDGCEDFVLCSVYSDYQADRLDEYLRLEEVRQFIRQQDPSGLLLMSELVLKLRDQFEEMVRAASFAEGKEPYFPGEPMELLERHDRIRLLTKWFSVIFPEQCIRQSKWTWYKSCSEAAKAVKRNRSTVSRALEAKVDWVRKCTDPKGIELDLSHPLWRCDK